MKIYTDGSAHPTNPGPGGLGIVVCDDNNNIINMNLDEMQNIINLYVLLEDKERKLIGEIVDIKTGNKLPIVTDEYISVYPCALKPFVEYFTLDNTKHTIKIKVK